MQCEHRAEENGDDVVTGIATAVLDEDAFFVAQGDGVGDEAAGLAISFSSPSATPQVPKALAAMMTRFNGVADFGDDLVVAAVDVVGGKAEFGLKCGDACLEVGLVRRLPDDENGAAEFLDEEVGGFDVGVEGAGDFAVGAGVGDEAAVGALVGKVTSMPRDGGFGGGEITGDDRGDHSAATATLRAGLDPGLFCRCAAGAAMNPHTRSTTVAIRRRP